MMEQVEKKLVCPGERVGHIEDCEAGEGTYIRGPYIHSSIVGTRETVAQDDGKTIVRVVRDEQPHSILVPELHSVVTARVTKVNSRFASVVILCVGSKPLKEPFLGIIRSQDIRATEQDKVEVYKCFRPGDIVLAEVISLGDSRSYFLGTAKNELGVVFAKSVTGTTMIPISWQEMVCPKTLQREFRKVAKITNS